MLIANPIYDVVFKYLLEDAKIARILIGSIIGETIEKLTFLPQEFVNEIEKSGKKPKTRPRLARKDSLTVYRLDFSARIKTPEGYKNVIIELQKAKFPTDIMRFRRYLGGQFSNKENVQRVKIGTTTRKTGLPIISIYFLGHKLDYTKASVIKVNRQYIDLIEGKVIDTKEAFIESLTLDSYVIQIPFLTDKRRNDLEILLSVFDQSNPADQDRHILKINENDFPEKYRPIIRKLQKAVEDASIKKKMELEDGIIDELEDMERVIEELELENEVIKQKAETIELEKEAIKQKAETIEQEKEAIKHKADAIEQENELLKKELEKLKNLMDKKQKDFPSE